MKKSQLNAGVILSYFTLAVNTVVQLVYIPIIIRILGKNEYGLYTLVGSVVNYLSLCGFGMTGSYLRFYSVYLKEDNKEKNASLNGIFLILNVIASSISIFLGNFLINNIEYILGSELTPWELERAKLLMEILVINIALSFPNSVFDSVLISQECFGFQRGIRLATAVMNPFMGIPLLLLGYGSVALVCVTTLLTILNLFVNGYYCIKHLHMRISFKYIDYALIKQIVIFSFFIFINMIIDQVNWNVDKFLLGRYWGTATVAVYGVAAQINSLYMQCSTAVSSVFAPIVNRYTAENTAENRQKINELFVFVGRMQFIILMLILSGIVFFGRVFIRLWVGEGYDEAYVVVLLLIVSVTIPLIQSLGIEIQRAQNKHHVRSIVYFCMMILNLMISIFLSKAYGAIGAATGTSISLILGNGLFMNYYYQKCLCVNVIRFWKEIFKIFPALIIPLLFGSCVMRIQDISSVVRLCILITCYCSIYAISIWLFGIKETEKVEIKNRVKKIYRK